jgi:hypothetical protein
MAMFFGYITRRVGIDGPFEVQSASVERIVVSHSKDDVVTQAAKAFVETLIQYDPTTRTVQAQAMCRAIKSLEASGTCEMHPFTCTVCV